MDLKDLLNLILYFFIFIIFLIFLNADYRISLDFETYIMFFNTLGKISLTDLSLNFFDNFPYIVDSSASVGGANWEFGFAILAYLLMQFFGPNLTYALIAATSLFIKVIAFNRFKINFFIIIFLLIISITLFEANALRLGLGLSIYLYGLAKNEQENKNIYFYIFLACSIHLSLIIFLLFHSLLYVIKLANYSILLILLLFLLLIVGLIRISDIVLLSISLLGTNIIGSKLFDYYALSDVLLLYQSPGINSVALIFLIIAFRSLLLMTFYKKGEKGTAILVLVFALTGFSFNTFSGNFYIIADRFIQPIIFASICLYFLIGFNNKQKNFYVQNKMSIRSLALNFNSFFLTFLIAFWTYSLLYTYPQSNVFSYIVGYNPLYIEPLF